jgi:hypothetical protein
MKIPTVEKRVEDIRRRATFLAYFFSMQRDAALAGVTYADADTDVFDALQDYVDGIVEATKAIDAAEAGSANPPAPDVIENDDDDAEAKGGAQ